MEPVCRWCGEHAWRTLDSMKDKWVALFEREHERAMRECQQLETLYKEVCWYNFETRCRTWTEPWHESWHRSPVQLTGHSYKQEWKNGRLRETATFPVWYSGPISGAPALPPEIILSELRDAQEYSRFTHEQQSAPHDWAPGGHKYEALVRQGDGAQAYHALYSQRRYK